MIELGRVVAVPLCLGAGWLIASVTGWRELRKWYPFDGRFDGPVRYWNVTRMGSMFLQTLVNAGFRPDGLHLRVSRTVRIIYPFHSPLLIPYADIEGRSTRLLLSTRGILDVGNTSISVPINILDRMERASEVSIEVVKHTEILDGEARGRVQIGLLEESFHSSLDFWKPDDYRKQWTFCLGELSSGRDCEFIVNWAPYPGGQICGESWPVYLIGDGEAAFRNRLLFTANGTDPYALSLPVRSGFDEDGDRLSEWIVEFDAIR